LWKGNAELEQSRRKMVAVFVAILWFCCVGHPVTFVTKPWENNKGWRGYNLDLERDGDQITSRR